MVRQVSEKSANALRTIGEVANELAVEPHVLRFWESKFTQIKPQKRRGRRYYRPQDVKLASIIKSLLYTQGFTIKGAQRFLKQHADKIDKSTVLELTESMMVVTPPKGAANANESAKSAQNKNQSVEKTDALEQREENSDQPALFDLSDASSNQGSASISEADKRRLTEVYRGLRYTKEQLDEAANS